MLLPQKLYQQIKAIDFRSLELRLSYIFGLNYLPARKKLSRLSSLAVTSAIVLVLFLTSLPAVPASATGLTWLDNQTYGLSEISTTPASGTSPNTGFGLKCSPGNLITRHYQVTTTWPYYLSEQSSGGCISSFPYGKMINTGYLQFNGTSVAGLKRKYNSSSEGFIGIPNSPHVWERAGGYGGQWGSNYAITRNFQSSITKTQSNQRS